MRPEDAVTRFITKEDQMNIRNTENSYQCPALEGLPLGWGWHARPERICPQVFTLLSGEYKLICLVS
jgi:hypothetical protein